MLLGSETGVKTFTCTRCGETKTEVIPATGVVASGTCGAEGDGSNLTWTLDSEGVLTISGSGGMHGYGPSDAPWHGRVKSAVIADGVTNIGSSAFDDCKSLASVTIPDSVTRIGNEFFTGCVALKSVIYDGTKAQWSAIRKGRDWDSDTGAYTIHCLDGYIVKQ